MAKNKDIIDLDVRTIGDPKNRPTDEDHKKISKFLKMDRVAQDEYLKKVKEREAQKTSVEA